MIGRVHSIVFDCPIPEELAAFYQRLLGGTLDVDLDESGPDGDGWVALTCGGGAPNLAFQRSPGYTAPRWPSEDGDQQLHLDIEVDDLDVADAALREVGARPVEARSGYRVYLDPVGHPFCTIIT